MPDKPVTLSAPRAPDPAIAQTAAAGRRLATAGSGGSSSTARAEAFAEFEAFFLQHTLESLLPKDTNSVYGKGLAGQMWKSMLAEKLAFEIARSGGVGIASALAAAEPAPATAPPAPARSALPTSISMPSAAAGTDAPWQTDVIAENAAQADAASPEPLQSGVLEP